MPKKHVKRCGGGDGGKVPTKRAFKLKPSAAEQVDPKTFEKFRVVKQRDKKRAAYDELRTQNKNAKRARRENREKVRKNLQENAPIKSVPKTKENTRVADVTMVDDVHDEEIKADERDDEFAKYFETGANPKVLITTCQKPHFKTRYFAREAQKLFPNSIVRPRKDYTLQEIIQFCKNREFTDVICITERIKEPFEMILCHLPEGPTATFRLSNFVPHDELENPGERTEHYPELNLKNFDTRLGRRIARMLEAIFPSKRDYAGRAVATFHNQRDFIFCRTHRYVFDSTKEVRIQELGPRFTLRLMSLQLGTFDRQMGEFEWVRKKEHDQDKHEWYL